MTPFPSSRVNRDAWHARRQAFLDEVRGMTGLEFVLEKRVGSPVARGATGTLYLPSAIERVPGRWWLGLNEGAFAACADARGVVLLCESGSELLDFWLPTEEVRELLPRLSSGKNHERQFNV